MPTVQESLLEQAKEVAAEAVMPGPSTTPEPTQTLTNGESLRPLVPGGKVGENEWNSRLAEALKRLGFPLAQFEPIVKLHAGGRGITRKPDVGVRNGGFHFVSGKLGERKELEAYRSADEYRTVFSNLKGLGEVFAVTYPAGRGELFHLHILPRVGRETAVSFTVENLEALAVRIADTIKGRIAEIERFAEPLASVAPRFLRNAALELSEAIRGVKDEDLEQVFGGKTFFRSVLQGVLPKAARRETLRLGAAFLFANQVFFYVLLSRAAQKAGKPQVFPSIIPGHAKSPEDLWTFYFSRVRERDYEPIYGHNVSPFFKGPEASEACVGVVKALLDLAPKLELPDLAGQVFQTLIPFDLRKPLGANYTNPRAAALLAALSIEDSGARVLDPACGSGTLLVAAYIRKRALSSGGTALDLHRRFLESELTGIDAMAFAGHLAAVNLALQQPLMETDYVRIGSIDSTTLHDPGTAGSLVPGAGDALPSEFVQSRLDAEFASKSRPQRKRTVAVSRAPPKEFTVDLQDLVMMNPPFTSRDNMSPSYRDRLAARFSVGEYRTATEGKKISQQAYFLLLADEFLRQGGRVASVLPLTTLGGKDYWPLVDFLCRYYTVRYIVVGLGRTSFSEDTSLSECLLIADKSPPPAESTFRLVGTLLPPDDWNHERLSTLIDGCQEGKSVEGISVVRKFPQSMLAPGEDMLPGLMLRLLPDYDRACGEIERVRRGSTTPFVKFAELRRRGLVYRERIEKARHLEELGASALFACRQEARALRRIDRLYLERESTDRAVFRDRFSGATYEFDTKELYPALRRLARLSSYDVSSISDYCVKTVGDSLRHVMEKVYGDRDGLRKWRRLKDRGFWDKVVKDNSARLVVAARIDFSSPGTTVVACWSTRPMFLASPNYIAEGLASPREERFLCMWLNSSLGVRQLLSATSATRGSWARIERFTLDRMWIPDFHVFSERIWEKSERLRENTSGMRVVSLLDQLAKGSEFRTALDEGLLDLLGFKEKAARASSGEVLRKGLGSAILALRESMGSGRDSTAEDGE